MPFVCFLMYIQGFPSSSGLFLSCGCFNYCGLALFCGKGVCLFCRVPSGVKSQEGPSGQFPIGPLGGW